MKLVVIPARGGSKRIPRKNIKPFAGRPIIEYSIEAALAAGIFDRVVVSTDDPEIAEVARRAGAEIPFKRPVELSDDHAVTSAVVAHAIEWFVDHGQTFGQVCCIYPAAPLVQASALLEGLQVLLNNDCDFVIPVAEYPFPIQRAVWTTPANRMVMAYPEHQATRSQDLPAAYHDAGQFYWGLADAWLQQKTLFGQNSVPLLIPRHRVCDIDTVEDWTEAELLYRAIKIRRSDLDVPSAAAGDSTIGR